MAPNRAKRITSGRPYFDNAVVEKSFNTHLHMIEALTVYHELRPEPRVRERLMELVVILSSTTLDRRASTGTDRYLRDWTRAGGLDALKVSYGHELERIWMLLGACQAAGIASGTMRGLVCAVFEASCRFGYDRKGGGFYSSGRLGRPAFDRRKFWWVQAEALVATATLYRLTGDTQYAHRFLRTLQWVARSQVDWRGGDWHRVIDERGAPGGPKADPWKTPYHNGRAMLLSLKLLPAADA